MSSSSQPQVYVFPFFGMLVILVCTIVVEFSCCCQASMYFCGSSKTSLVDLAWVVFFFFFFFFNTDHAWVVSDDRSRIYFLLFSSLFQLTLMAKQSTHCSAVGMRFCLNWDCEVLVTGCDCRQVPDWCGQSLGCRDSSEKEKGRTLAF